MSLNEDVGGGFKFKKRERKNRIKTVAERPDDDEEPKAEAANAVPINDIDSQAHHAPRRESIDCSNAQVNVEEKKEEEEGTNAEVNKEEANADEREGKDGGEGEGKDGGEGEGKDGGEGEGKDGGEGEGKDGGKEEGKDGGKGEGKDDGKGANNVAEGGPVGNDTKDVKEATGPSGLPSGMPVRVTSSPKKAPKFKQRKSKEFKSRPPKKGVIGFGDDIPGMDGLGTDITVICPWEAFSHLELHELAQFGII